MSELIITTVLTAIISPILVLFIKHFLDKKAKKDKNKPGKQKVVEHPLFVELEHMIEVSIKKLCIQGEVKKTMMVRKFLEIKALSVHKNFFKLAESVDKGYITLYEYHKTITNTIVEYESKAEKANIPEIFIRRFSEWHTGKVELIFETIDYVTKSPIYETDIEKLSIVLKLISTIMHMTVMDAEKVIKSMNGELEEALKDYEY